MKMAANLSDKELRQHLIAMGKDPGPIVCSTRKVYEDLYDQLASEKVSRVRLGLRIPVLKN